MYKKGAQQYSRVSIETEISNADPHRLIQLLLEGALTRLAMAKQHIESNDIENKNLKLSQVVDILGTLQESLDHEKGGEISGNLERLYDYISRRVFDANRLNDIDILNEVMGLLLEVKSGWEGIRESYEEMKNKGQFQPVQGKSSLSV